MSRRVVIYYTVAVLVIALDQFTKYLAESQLTYGVPVRVLPVFDLTLAYNRGAAFSFLSDAGGWQRWLFTGIAGLVSVVLVVWLYRLKPQEKVLGAALSLILGGALGNLWDRVTLGHVVDFISLHWGEHYFPAFNIADSAITIGAGLMLLDIFLQRNDTGAASREGGA